VAGVEKVVIRTPPEWEKALPGFEVWFTRFVRDVLSKADVRNAITDGTIVITGSPGERATITTNGFGANSFFAPRAIQPAPDMTQAIGEVRAFLPPPTSVPIDQLHTIGEIRSFMPPQAVIPFDQLHTLAEIRSFVRAEPARVEYADSQTILAQRIFGG
jgi:hypothetical protein